MEVDGIFAFFDTCLDGSQTTGLDGTRQAFKMIVFWSYSVDPARPLLNHARLPFLEKLFIWGIDCFRSDSSLWPEVGPLYLTRDVSLVQESRGTDDAMRRCGLHLRCRAIISSTNRLDDACGHGYSASLERHVSKHMLMSSAMIIAAKAHLSSSAR